MSSGSAYARAGVDIDAKANALAHTRHVGVGIPAGEVRRRMDVGPSRLDDRHPQGMLDGAPVEFIVAGDRRKDR